MHSKFVIGLVRFAVFAPTSRCFWPLCSRRESIVAPMASGLKSLSLKKLLWPVTLVICPECVWEICSGDAFRITIAVGPLPAFLMFRVRSEWGSSCASKCETWWDDSPHVWPRVHRSNLQHDGNLGHERHHSERLLFPFFWRSMTRRLCERQRVCDDGNRKLR